MRFIDAKTLGSIVRFHRKKSGLSQAELGKIAGLGKTVVFDIEKGRLSVKLETLLKIFEVLNIKIDFQSPLMKVYEES